MEQREDEFDNRFSRTFGLPSERAATKVKTSLAEAVKNFIEESPFMVMATSNASGQCDASPKGGKPGFVRVIDDNHLLVPDVSGNKLFQSYQNLDENPHVGLLFLIPGLTDVVRVNGRATITSREELDQHRVERSMYNPDGDRGVLQGIIIEVEESYGHCPRSLNYSDFWNVERIQQKKGTAHPVRLGPAPSAPRPSA